MKVDLKYKVLFICLMIICLPVISMANEELILPEYTESYKEWMELPEEERENYIEPQMYETVEEESGEAQAFSVDTNELEAASLPSRCTRQTEMNVKNQGATNACWAYSAATVFDSNYSIINKKKKTFANMHMEYMTSNAYNTNGFARRVDSGGNMMIALAYATNGMGIALEADMPASITSASLKKVKAKAKVDDYVVLSNRNQVKNYIYKYGVVSGTTYVSGNQYFSSGSLYYNDDLAYCCTNRNQLVNHAITIVGWDDNYTNASFPGRKGAYIVLNSYGARFGDNGIYYIFYDDAIIGSNYLFGVMKTTDMNYDHLYQHDPYGWTAEGGYTSGTYAANVFTRQNVSKPEKITKVSTYVPSAGNITIYINPNNNDVRTSSATTVINRYIDQRGYYTIDLDSPIYVRDTQFVVGIKYPGSMGAEIPTSSGWCSTATSNSGESYISYNGRDYDELQAVYASHGYKYANACIKAFTQDATLAEIKAENEYRGDLINYVFDYKYYADHNLDLYNAYGYNQTALKNHWNNYGKAEGRASSPVFNVAYYLANNSDVRAAVGNNYVAVYNHFMNYGYAEYRKTSPEYDGTYYLKNNADLADMTSMELIRHYALYGRNELRRASSTYDVTNFMFDSKIYASCNPDVAAAYGNNEALLRKHWYSYGIAEGRIASLIFDAKYYLANCKDVANAYGKNAYAAAYSHFINYGFSEGRQGNAIFLASYYLSKNTDIKNAYGNNYLKAVNHFTLYGKNEARNTSSKFKVSDYRSKNGDLLSAYQNNYAKYFEHYLMYGKNEKRTCI